jgi:hypothetical protein
LQFYSINKCIKIERKSKYMLANRKKNKKIIDNLVKRKIIEKTEIIR